VSRKYPILISTWTLAYLTDIHDICHCFFRNLSHLTDCQASSYRRCTVRYTDISVTQQSTNSSAILLNSSSSSQGPLSLPFSGYPASFKGVKRSERELDNLPSFSAKVKDECSYTSTASVSPYCLDRHHEISELYIN
jgi:hypothetical protein